MVSSILTNNGALTALQSLKATQKNLLSTQNRISTGMKVANAKDNAATWAVATAMRSDIANTKQVSENLSVSSSIVATASAAAETIADLVKQIRTKVTSAQNPAVDKAQVQADIDGYLAQIGTTVNAASFKGVNLVNGDGTQRVLTSVNSVNGVSTAAYADVAKQDLSVSKGSLLEGLKDLTVLSRADQTLANLNDGVQKITLSTSGTLALKAGNEVAMKYIDSSGTDRTLTVKITKDISTVANLVTYLNADAGFSAEFTADPSVAAGVISTTDFTISAKNRDSVMRLGSNSGTTAVAMTSILKAQVGANGVALTAAALGAGNTNGLAGGINVASMTFADKPLVEGDEFILKVDLTPATVTTDKGDITYKLKVVGGTAVTGDMISDGSDPANRIFTIAVAAADVTNPNITGKTIAEKLRDALVTGTSSTKWNVNAITTPTALLGGAFLNSAASAGTSYSATVDSITGALVIKSADATDGIMSFNSSKTDYDVLLTKLDAAGGAVTNAAAAFGTAATRIDLQKDFLDKLVDTLNTGLGALVDADMSEEAARLQALQVQEQLGTQALSIANQAPQSILRLFQ